jgi:hypothetical protein
MLLIYKILLSALLIVITSYLVGYIYFLQKLHKDEAAEIPVIYHPRMMDYYVDELFNEDLYNSKLYNFLTAKYKLQDAGAAGDYSIFYIEDDKSVFYKDFSTNSIIMQDIKILETHELKCFSPASDIYKAGCILEAK